MPILLTPGDDDVSYVTSNDPLEIYGLDGNDTIAGGNNSDYIDGGTGNDTLRDLGGFGNDHFVGGIGADVLFAVAGNDWLEGGADNDVARGGSGNDVLDGGSGNDALSGEGDDDTLFAGTGQDTLFGGDGNDLFYADGSFGDGPDVLRGEAGNDVYVIYGANVSFAVSDPGLDRIEANFSYSLAGLDVEDLTLTGAGAINGTGNGLANTLNGNDAANAISGEGGNDLIRGYGGNDTLTGGQDGGVEYLYGGTGDDTFNVLDSQDAPVEFAGEGTDTIRSPIAWLLSANPQVENLVLTGAAAINGFGNGLANVITGNDATNFMDGGTGLDTLVGGLGDDSYGLNDLTYDPIYGPDYDRIVEAPGGGIDTVYVSQQGLDRFYLDNNLENVVVTGSDGLNVVANGLDNVLTGNAAHNFLAGDTGNDTLIGAGGIDELDGGAGNDTYYLDDLWQANQFALYTYDVVDEAPGGGIDTVYVQSLDNTDTVFATDGYTLGAEIEIGIITGGNAFNLTGGVLANALTGNAAANTLSGLGGNDTLAGGAAYDRLFGGAGDDTYVLNDLNAPNMFSLYAYDLVSENPGEGIDTVLVLALDNPDTFASVETYTLGAEIENGTVTGSDAFNLAGNASNNLLTGNGAANVFNGGEGADTLNGAGGNDTLNGGAGTDTLNGGAGNDTYIDPAGDTLVEAANGGTDTVQSITSFDLTAFVNVERLFLTGAAATTGTGNSLANQMLANDAANTLNGRDGNDTINAGGGSDTVNGGSGLDRLIGGLQRDKIIPGADNVQDTIVYSLIGESTGATRDVIAGLDLNAEDKLDLPGAVSSIAAARSGALSLATFNANLASVFTAAALPTGSAALFTPTSGDLAQPGMVYLIVDANGVAGYQANQDWVFQLENHTGTLNTSDFI